MSHARVKPFSDGAASVHALAHAAFYSRGSIPAPESARCPSGFQCIPNSAWDADTLETNIIVDQYGFDGACTPCAYGQYCPENTTNINRLQAFLNICPPGYNCPAPGQLERCRAGRFCPPGTYTGGEVCSSDSLRESYQSWGQALYCPTGSKPEMIGMSSSGLLRFLCPAGRFCPNSSVSIGCPPGHFCPTGVNASTPCKPGPLLGQDAAQRCPAGSTHEPAWVENLVYLCVTFVPILFLLEVRKHQALSCPPACSLFANFAHLLTNPHAPHGRYGRAVRSGHGATSTAGCRCSPPLAASGQMMMRKMMHSLPRARARCSISSLLAGAGPVRAPQAACRWMRQRTRRAGTLGSSSAESAAHWHAGTSEWARATSLQVTLSVCRSRSVCHRRSRSRHRKGTTATTESGWQDGSPRGSRAMLSTVSRKSPHGATRTHLALACALTRLTSSRTLVRPSKKQT